MSDHDFVIPPEAWERCKQIGDVPPFLRHRDPDHRDEREQRRDQYALRGEQDRPLKVNYGYGTHPFTVEDALVWGERRAAWVLAAGREDG
jgi:hypothetical protein